MYTCTDEVTLWLEQMSEINMSRSLKFLTRCDVFCASKPKITTLKGTNLFNSIKMLSRLLKLLWDF